MTDGDQIEFWFAIGSTYSYLSAMRLDEVERDTGMRFRWRPFGLRSIMREMNNIPFATKLIKAAYMWRDIERRAQKYGFSICRPVPYPITEFDLANRIAVLGAREGWCAQYVRATYGHWLRHGQEPGAEPNMSASLRDIGEDPGRVVAMARSDQIERAYHDATDAARALGIFGAPTFVIDTELFWGDDRLDDAINWRRYGQLTPR